MPLEDKADILERIRTGAFSGPVVLDIGCGPAKTPGRIGVDQQAYDGVDIVGDAADVLMRLPDASVDAIVTRHFVEHVVDLDALLKEFVRVTRVGATIEIVAPHFSNPYFYSDPTHRRFFGLYTFCYFAESDMFSRRVPPYSQLAGIRLERVDLVFKSTRPFLVRHGIKWLLGLVVNSCRYAKELYEEFFCFVIPCYEVRYVVARTSEHR